MVYEPPSLCVCVCARALRAPPCCLLACGQVSIRRVEYTDAVTSGGQGASGASSTRGASALKTAFTASADNTAAPLPRLHALCVEPGADTIARVVNSGHTLEGFTIRPGEDYHLRLRVSVEGRWPGVRVASAGLWVRVKCDGGGHSGDD